MKAKKQGKCQLLQLDISPSQRMDKNETRIERKLEKNIEITAAFELYFRKISLPQRGDSFRKLNPPKS